MLRPLPKVSVATTGITATADPASAERTGTAPRARSRANRIPATAEIGMPPAAAEPAILDRVAGMSLIWGTWWGAAR